MALQRLGSLDDAFYRNRSASCTSPVRQRVVYQQVYTAGALVRSYSCDQVFTSGGRKLVKATRICVTDFVTPSRKLRREKRESPGCRLRTLSPPSGRHSRKALFATVQTPEVTPNEEKRFKPVRYLPLILIVTFLIPFLFLKSKEVEEWNLQKTLVELNTYVIGQEQAVSQIIDAVSSFQYATDPLVLVFTGGVGVGKTLTSSIIHRTFPNEQFQKVFFMDTSKTLMNKSFFFKDLSLVTIEDINIVDLPLIVKLVESLKMLSNKKLLLILIFKTHSNNEELVILQHLKHKFNNLIHVPFKELSEESVSTCIQNEMQKMKLDLNREAFLSLLKEQLAPIDILNSSPGCKGITDKLSQFFLPPLQNPRY